MNFEILVTHFIIIININILLVGIIYDFVFLYYHLLHPVIDLLFINQFILYNNVR
jgi:hypothetical protein